MKSLLICFYFLISLSLSSTKANGQTRFFKFKITNEGIYKISPSQMQEIGAQNLSQVAIFGLPGMLPQQLDSAQLNWQEIPGFEKNGELYYYLTGPHQMVRDSSSKIAYQHHLYADSLSFLIGVKPNPKRIIQYKLKPGNNPASTLYRYQNLKEEENNLLNSGRTWYSKPINSGSLKGFSIRAQTNSLAPWTLSGKLIGRSATGIDISLRADDSEIFKSTASPIAATLYAPKGREIEVDAEFRPNGNKLERLVISTQSADQNGISYMDYLSLGIPFSSQGLSEGVYFADPNSTFELRVNNPFETWDVSDFFSPYVLDFTEGNQFKGGKLLVFHPAQTLSLPVFTPVTTQIRNRESWPSLLIIAPKSLQFTAEKLKSHKTSIGLDTEVIVLQEIYDAFGYGNPDLTAIRNVIAWHFHQGKKLKNVLILGKGTYDYKRKLGGRPNLIPIYTSRNSLNPLTTFSSDDYYGLINWGQGEWIETNQGDEQMQIGIGRIPVISTQEAEIVLDKIIQYENNPIPGIWKNTITLLADDGDNGIHLRDSEIHAAYLLQNRPDLTTSKLYLDRFEQPKNGSLQSSPIAKSKLEEALQEGTVILNYIGHGNETTLTAEEIFKVSDIQNWANQPKLAIWMTATCEFGRHDSPFLRSAAEELLIAPKKGAVGLLSTGRPVFSSVNFQLNEMFIQEAFKSNGNDSKDLGTIFKNTKNASLNGSLNRSFSLLGDPSLKLASADHQVKILSIKDAQTSQNLDTLAALQTVEFTAEVIHSQSGMLVGDFSGQYEIELRDQPLLIKTLGDESSPKEFKEEPNAIFRGTGAVKNGLMKGKLIVPQNINQNLEAGKLRIVAVSEKSTDAFGMTSITLGGQVSNLPLDTLGPEIKVMIDSKNQEPFVSQSTSILLTATLQDPSGIDISSSKTEQELHVRLNENAPIPVYMKFISENGSFEKGTFSIRLEGLKEGKNLVTIQGFDNLGNISTLLVEVEVKNSNQLRILAFKNFPNPAETDTQFEIIHNRPGENLLASLKVFNVNGQILFDQIFRFVKADTKIEDMSWFFSQDQTKYPAKGSYIYTLSLTSEKDNSSTAVSGKIVIK